MRYHEYQQLFFKEIQIDDEVDISTGSTTQYHNEWYIAVGMPTHITSNVYRYVWTPTNP